MNNTIQKLKELDLFDEFKSAMEILVEETSKPQIEWDDGGLNCAGLRYNPDFYINIHANHAEGYYENKNEEYLSDVALCSLDPAITDSESFRSAYYIGSYDDFHISSLSFGCIDWNPYWCLKGYRDFDVKEDSWCDYGRYATSNYTEERDEYSKGDYYDYLDKVTDISFSCFEGKTPQEILTILNEVK